MNQTKTTSADYIEISQIFSALLRKWYLMVIACILGAAIAFSYANFFVTPLYRAKSTMLVDLRTSTEEKLSYERVTIAEKYLQTFASIIKTNTVLEPVIEELDLQESPSSLASKIVVTAVEDTLLININLDYPDKKKALAIIETIDRLAPEIIKERIAGGKIIEIETPAVSSTPVSPDIFKYTSIGIILGLVISAGCIVLAAIINNKVRSTEDLKRVLDLPILGVIPIFGTETKNRGGKK